MKITKKYLIYGVGLAYSKLLLCICSTKEVAEKYIEKQGHKLNGIYKLIYEEIDWVEE